LLRWHELVKIAQYEEAYWRMMHLPQGSPRMLRREVKDVQSQSENPHCRR
jgi:hypothetical protein